MDVPRKYEYNENVLSKLPRKLYEKLMPFQKEGVEFAIGKNGCCLIADEMGLGKTLQAISVAYYYRDEWPLLIIVPSSLKFCWIEELEKWLPDVLPHHINLVHCGSDASGIANSLITIVTYGLLRLPSSKVLREAIESCKFKVVICDESHYLKNHKSLSCKVIIPLIKSAERRILLSGTPALAKPVELYSQIDAICPKKFGTFWQFADRYCDAHTVFYGKFRKRKIDGASNLEELQKKLTDLMLMIRREKSEVLTELPPKQRQRILFELKASALKKEILDKFSELRKQIHQGNKEVQSIFQAAEAQELVRDNSFDKEGNSKQELSIFSQISNLYKLSGDAKIGPVREYIEMLCDSDDLKFLVFAYHHDMMNGIEQALWEKNVKFVRIDGTTKSVDRQQCVSQFQSDPDTRVAILSILAAGVGLTFTAAKLVVFAELYWTPGVMMQCEDRAHRIGQTCSLPVHYLVAKGTMDEWVWAAVCKKTVVTSTALTGRRKQIELTDGNKDQIDLLSNAEMWEPKADDSQLNISDIVRNSRQADQSSILEFFTPTKQCDLKPPTKKRKLSEMDTHQTSKFSKQILKTDNGKLDLQSKGHTSSDVVVISDDDDNDFTIKSLKNKFTYKKKKMNNLHADGNVEAHKKHLNDQTVKMDLENECRKNDHKSQNKQNIMDHVCQPQDCVISLSIKQQAGGKKALVNEKNDELFSGDGEVQEDNSNTPWSCKVCTFNNHIALSLCEMCSTPKKHKAPPMSKKLNGCGKRSPSHSKKLESFLNGSSITEPLIKDSHENKETVTCENTNYTAIKSSKSSDDSESSIKEEELFDDIDEEKSLEKSLTESLEHCYKSFTEKSHDLPNRVSPHINTSSNKTEQLQNQPCNDICKSLMFSCSLYTGRIYVYNQDGLSLEASFLPIDIELGNLSELPSILQLSPNLKLLQKFVREWSSLTETKRRLIAKNGLKFISPLATYNKVRTVKGSKQRYLTKGDIMESALYKAKAVQGSIRFISKEPTVSSAIAQESSGNESLQGLAQTVTEDGLPLCLHCQKPYSNPLLMSKTVSNPENAWQLRLCSYPCMDKYWTLTKASYCRDQIYEIEKGVCKLCQFDADNFYNRIRVTKGAKVKLNLINKSPYSELTAKQKQKMIEHPQAGQFWHVDHITPVWQGGGMCDLDNLRTLCTPCHLRITQRQAGERATVKKLTGACNNRDITAFFQRL
ncbi:LOW QUALITY PROTEIN: DNA annealing helicase and endonuclease ZRANB3-like [Biomphalaria glabrata]|uniref:LOW QUALITY PROTEIN: DNA annealing helicase and endonuclease ZRANB3-like n=1 Tax=Biomphalaria glabrata TaxID=6526 RepID=A0A9U8E1I8_BIOGL|nr:LOW QUALITY PROTEIN: DNA annealing helicase and endonuclease ZRANB3-like [Biomphalaria glabrata]